MGTGKSGDGDGQKQPGLCLLLESSTETILRSEIVIESAYSSEWLRVSEVYLNDVSLMRVGVQFRVYSVGVES
jgi:hypothetical protein